MMPLTLKKEALKEESVCPKFLLDFGKVQRFPGSTPLKVMTTIHCSRKGLQRHPFRVSDQTRGRCTFQLVAQKDEVEKPVSWNPGGVWKEEASALLYWGTENSAPRCGNYGPGVCAVRVPAAVVDGRYSMIISTQKEWLWFPWTECLMTEPAFFYKRSIQIFDIRVALLSFPSLILYWICNAC